ncbi:VOC family protein [Streptomyces sp. NPDC004838]
MRRRGHARGRSEAASFGKTPGAGAYLTFAAEDVAATVDQLRQRGADVSDPTVEPWGTYATVEAPDGHKLQFNECPGR